MPIDEHKTSKHTVFMNITFATWKTLSDRTITSTERRVLQSLTAAGVLGVLGGAILAFADLIMSLAWPVH